MSRILLIGVIGLLTACHAWQVQSVTPETLLTSPSPPSRVRVRLQDSTRVVLVSPHVSGDSVAGLLAGDKASRSAAMPLQSITEIAVRRFSPERTLGLVGASAAGLFVIAAIGCEMSDCTGLEFGSAARQ